MATQVHAVCRNCILGVYMNSLRDAGFRSDICWRETFFEPWRKKFDLFLKTAFYVSKGTFWVKKTFSKFLFFFKLFTTLNEHLLCLARNFRQGYQNWKMQFSSHKMNQKIKLLKVLFLFSKSSELWTNIYRVRGKTFRQGYQNWKLQSSSQKMNQKIKFLKVLFFFNFFRNLNKQLPRLEKNFRAVISLLKIVLYVFRISFWR